MGSRMIEIIGAYLLAVLVGVLTILGLLVVAVLIIWVAKAEGWIE
jgi:hypothetical protein